MIHFKVKQSNIPMSVEKATVINIGEGGSTARIGYVTFTAGGWVGDTSPYSQVVSVEGATKNSQVDLTPNLEQLLVFAEKDITFFTINRNGTVTVYAIGQKPVNDYTMQVTLTDVKHDGEIIGITVGTPLSVEQIKARINPITSVNGVEADEDGNVEINAQGLSDEEVMKLQVALQ